MTTHDGNNCASIRAIEEERSKQVRERSAILKEEARKPRDKRAEIKRVEALITIVACAIGVSHETEEGKITLFDRCFGWASQDTVNRARFQTSGNLERVVTTTGKCAPEGMVYTSRISCHIIGL